MMISIRIFLICIKSEKEDLEIKTKIFQELQKIEYTVHLHMKDTKDNAEDFLSGLKKSIQK